MSAADLTDRMRRFEQAWAAGPPPDLADFLPAARRAAAAELVKVDLHRRWGPPADQIAEEYLVRHQWGDRPPAADYLAAFPARADDLPAALAAADAEVAAARAGWPPHPVGWLAALADLRVLTRAQVRAAAAAPADPGRLADWLTARGWVTPFQAAECRAGGLAVGPYVLTAPIGAGTSGRV